MKGRCRRCSSIEEPGQIWRGGIVDGCEGVQQELVVSSEFDKESVELL